MEKYPNKVNREFIVCDKSPISTTQLILGLAEGAQRSPRLFYMPKYLVRLILLILYQGKIYDRLFLSFVVSSSETYEYFDWLPGMETLETLKSIMGSKHLKLDKERENA